MSIGQTQKAKTTLTDSIGGKQVFIGEWNNDKDLIHVKQIIPDSSVIINTHEIDHVFISGDFMILELKDERRLAFRLKIEELPIKA